ncbi:MAG: ribose-5-phosphate isomerase RpiA [Methylococcales symbiont of Hymedesmia sp. n. MRB-2018]|nr:MAG: ribose-5-phosphate isomerase RpiA [Methylococcales symbiont of Hymedesmia sp. n. MRB-2018]KAF3983951.1 MAG: ribose-5-phosphate isomerase RpiA [Methylococcales symbiont of Hymedesmia sp. n. MRB-2018]
MTQDELKKQVARSAIEYIKNVPVIGVGTGSTVNFFIEMLADYTSSIDATVSSSIDTTRRLESVGITVLDLNEVNNVEVYIDGADEVDPKKKLIKGGGGALTREKIIAGASDKFVCIVDSSKTVDVLGGFPLPIEVIPMSREFVAGEMKKMGGQPVWRENFISDNGCEIIDIHNLYIRDPMEMERVINNIPGVVTVGLFALRDADVVLIGDGDKVITR